MTLKTRSISALVESQLPQFILDDYEYFAKFLKAYYAQQELRGGVLDIVANLTKYRDINFYDLDILNSSSKTLAVTGISETTISVDNTLGFPDQGLAKIDDEIFFYGSKTDNSFTNVYRGVSGTTSLGDLYNESTFVSTTATTHIAGSKVQNLTNLFLYALLTSFESEFLAGIPEKYLRGEIDKRVLIKNISSFYKAKGTKRSIQFIFNSLVSSDDTDVYYPKDTTLKASESDWSNVHAIKVVSVYGDPLTLVGKVITETGDNYASAVVDNVKKEQTVDGDQIWELILSRSSINNTFSVSNKTKLTKEITSSHQVGSKIEVDSTFGWEKEGFIFIGGEVIEYSSKTIRQFTIKSRFSSQTHSIGTALYDNKKVTGNGVELIPLGVVYNLNPDTNTPYGIEGETVVVEDSGFDTIDPIIKKSDNTIRWMFPSSSSTVQSGDTRTLNQNTDTIPGIQQIFSDENNYYFCTSGFPLDRTVFYNQSLDSAKTPGDLPTLRTIRKHPITTTEVYPTVRKDIGVFVDGTIAYSHKHEDSVFFGGITKITVNNQGTGYTRSPFVLVNNLPYKATANLAGTVVESINIIEAGSYTVAPDVDIVSGRNAILTPVVTKGVITSLVIADPGEYYSAPPTIRIVDSQGRGRFAEYTCTISAAGQITSTTRINGGNFYSDGNVIIQIIPDGANATATASIYEWIKNRYEVTTDKDTEYGFSHKNDQGFYQYGVLSYSPTLKTLMSDTGINHSPIIGYAYDGNPIYGPYGYTDPVDSTTAIVKMTSGYEKRSSRSDGPSIVSYPLGTFIQDYYYIDRYASLDKNNGRFCVTPEYPKGTYAYFVTLDSTDVPAYPYILGENFYSLPLAANYEQNQTHNDITIDATRLRTPGIPQNGLKARATIKDTSTGSVDGFQIYGSSSNFKVGSELVLDNAGTSGSNASGSISSIEGKTVTEIRATDQRKVAKVQITNNCYVFSEDKLSQPSSGAYGTVVGDVLDGKVLVLEDVVGTFDESGLFDATTLSINVVLSSNATFTAGAAIELTDGSNVLATGEVIESTEKRNSVKLKVKSGTFSPQAGYFLKSDNLLNTIGATILTTQSLSTGLVPFKVITNIALVKTTGDHELGIGDVVNISIDPDDSLTTTTKYVQLGAIQEIELKAPSFTTALNDAGLGRADLRNGGLDYATNTYNNIELIFSDQNANRTNIGAVGDSGNARATIVVSSAGSVTSVVITSKGSGYIKGDVLTVEDSSLSRASSATSTQRLRLVVDHIGFSSGETILTVDNVSGFANNDLIKVGDELLKITAISATDNELTVLRAQNNTHDIDHFDDEVVHLYQGSYKFTPGSTVPITGVTALDPVILSFTNNKLVVEHDQGFFIAGDFAKYKVFEESTVFDESLPKRNIEITAVSDYKIVTKISDTVSGPYEISPNINIQEFYQYRFDVSHFTNGYAEFVVSPSQNDNIIAEEVVRVGSPGLPDSYVYVKFGYGPRIGDISLTGTLTDRKPRSYQRYYYKSIVRTMQNGDNTIRIGNISTIEDNNNYLEVINDPLQGRYEVSDALTAGSESVESGVKVSFVTANRFVYELTELPEWYGTGVMKYTTTSRSAIGAINSVSVSNLGSGYKKVPLVLGGELNNVYTATVSAEWDAVNKNITGVVINTAGSNYSKPKVVVSDGDGTEAEFKVLKTFTNNIARVDVINKGKNYSYKPSLKVIEGDVRAYALGSSIGITKNVDIEFNSSGVWNDKSILRKHSCSIALIVDTTDEFLNGERVTQGNSVGTVVANGWRRGSNILKVSINSGEFVTGVNVVGSASRASGKVISALKTEFNVDLRSYWDNLGTFTSDKGKVGVRTHKIADNHFYQDYSYVVESKTGIEDWRDLIKESVHPAGFKVFGELNIDGKADVKINENSKTSQVSTLKLWNEETNKATVVDTKRHHQTVINLNQDLNILRGNGSVTEKSSDTSGLIARELTLTPAFDGDFNSDGNITGTREFTIIDTKSNQPITPYNAVALTITLDGVLQEPETSYTVTGNTITFAKAPFGPRVVDSNSISATKFVGRLFQFKDNTLNVQHLKKVRPIFQKEGTWIDAANQLRFNRTFIQEEAIGYAKSTYPYITWNQYESKCIRDIGLIVDAFEHDLRFGGNTATHDAASKYFNEGVLSHISAQLSESIATYKYAMNLCIAATRNWDLSLTGCTVTQGVDIIEVPSSLGICVGMTVSSGQQFDPGTTVTEILSDTRIKVSKTSNLSYSGQTITTSVTNTGQTNYGPVQIGTGGTLTIGVGAVTTIYSTINNIGEVTFSFSRINDGMFMDAAYLIENNKQYIQEETLGWVKATYPSINIPSEDKCKRDTGYLVDAIVYHIRYGGNYNVIDFAERYYFGNKLSHIVDQKAESIAAYGYAINLMITAIKSTLPTGTYTSVVPFSDNTILPDPNGGSVGNCALVEQTLDTYKTLVSDTINKGPNIFEKTVDNNQRTGNWSPSKTYTNINILSKANIFTECSDVSSALNALFLNVQNILNGTTVEKSTPDYFDGVNKEFELYYTDNTLVKTSVGQDLFMVVNGIFQNAKYDETFPRGNAYYIKRDADASIPDKVIFAEAPKWEQRGNTLLVQEPLSVEKFFAHNVGGYTRLVIREENFNDIVTGPFVMRNEETGEVVVVDDDRFLFVFIDGVLQKRTTAYTINESSITFSQPLRKGQSVDIALFIGTSTDQLLDGYNIEPNLFLNEVTVTVTGADSAYDTFITGVKDGTIVYQGVKSLGIVRKYQKTASNWYWTMSSQNPDIDFTQPIRVAANTDIVNADYVEVDLSSATTEVSYVSENGKRIMKKDAAGWLYDTVRPGITNVEPGDRIQIDGEDEYRLVKRVPNRVNPLGFVPNTQASNDSVATIAVSNYNGISRGEGLDITAVITSGVVTSLTWNKRELSKNPDAYQYDSPPILTFEPLDTNGGGAKAHVIVDGGEVLDVVLDEGGSGYTSAPIVNVSRGYNIIKKHRTFDTKYTRNIVAAANPGITNTVAVITDPIQQSFEFSHSATIAAGSVKQLTNTIITNFDNSVVGKTLEVRVSPNNSVVQNAITSASFDESVFQKQIQLQSLVSSTTNNIVSTPVNTPTVGMGSSTTSISNALLLDSDFSWGDAFVYVTNPTNFTASGEVLCGKFPLEYSSKTGTTLAVLYNGTVQGTINIITTGTGYPLSGTCGVTGGTGSGLTVNFTSGTGDVNYITANFGGLGYSVNDTITLQAGNNDCTATITSVSTNVNTSQPTGLTTELAGTVVRQV